MPAQRSPRRKSPGSARRSASPGPNCRQAPPDNHKREPQDPVRSQVCRMSAIRSSFSAARGSGQSPAAHCTDLCDGCSFEGKSLNAESAITHEIATLAGQTSEQAFRHVNDVLRRELVQMCGVWRASYLRLWQTGDCGKERRRQSRFRWSRIRPTPPPNFESSKFTTKALRPGNCASVYR